MLSIAQGAATAAKHKTLSSVKISEDSSHCHYQAETLQANASQ